MLVLLARKKKLRVRKKTPRTAFLYVQTSSNRRSSRGALHNINARCYYFIICHSGFSRAPVVRSQPVAAANRFRTVPWRRRTEVWVRHLRVFLSTDPQLGLFRGRYEIDNRIKNPIFRKKHYGRAGRLRGCTHNRSWLSHLGAQKI